MSRCAQSWTIFPLDTLVTDVGVAYTYKCLSFVATFSSIFRYIPHTGAHSGTIGHLRCRGVPTTTRSIMKKHAFPLLLALIVMLISFTSRQATADTTQQLPTKQLAGIPADILNGTVAPPNAADAGIRSHAAMLPIHLTPNADGGWSWQTDIPLDSGRNVTLALFAPNSAAWTLSWQAPGATTAQSLTGSGQSGSMGINELQFPATVYHFDRIQAGTYRLRIAASVAPTTNGSQPHGYIAVSSDSAYRLYTHLSSYNLIQGEQVGLVSYAFRENAGTERPAPLNGLLQEVAMTLRLPDGGRQTIAMFDDGRHADGAAQDGVYGGLFTAAQTGSYTAQVLARGVTPAGRPFARTSEHTFPIVAPMLTLDNTPAQAHVINSNQWRIDLAATATGTVSSVKAFAEVWGTGADGEMVPVVWIGGVVNPTISSAGTQLSLSLALDGRWIARAGARAPFELRQVRVQDLNTHIPLAQVAVLPLMAREMPASAYEIAPAITNDMLMGSRPAALPASPDSGSVLMLVHGYCSTSVWPTANFTNYTLFLDLNQNRTHDEFAQLIGNFGAQYDSFGVVAHSQGGDASLHLYTYYWSGLDNATGPRLIQSVGTPYQGTALAGNLALLGEIFGVGCGTNFDLTYDGSAWWLSGIPSWARSDVYYYTTSDKDVWWRWDFCNPVTTIFLDDPDDGVVEKWAGQLSGAHNMGHKEGWCHIDSWVMRDPGQTTDASRNSTMNANAAR